MTDPRHDSETHESGSGSRRLLDQLSKGLIRFRLPLFLVTLLLGAAAWTPASRLSFDRSIEGMFEADDPRLQHYQEGEAAFGGSETAVVGYTDQQLLTAAGLQRLQALEAELRKTPGVGRVASLAQARLPGSLLATQSLPEQVAAGRVSEEELRREILGSELYRGRLISLDGETTVLLVTFAPERDSDSPRSETIRRIREICNRHDPPAVIAGGPILVNEVYEHLERDGRNLGVASAVVLALVIAILFRNLRWIVLPLAVVQLTLLWTKALLVVSGSKLSMVSSPLVALVTVIGTATVVHVAIRFREERAAAAPVEALRRTIKHIVPAIFWTCVTTSLGFCSLMGSRVGPVASFGGMMAMGSAMVFVAAVGLLPGGVLLGGRFTDPQHAPGESKLSRWLDWILTLVERRPRWVAAGVLAMLVVTSLGALRLEVATEFDQNFHPSSPIVTSYQYLIDKMKTTKTVDVLIDVPDLDQPGALGEFLDEVEQTQRTLERRPGVLGTLSVVDMLQFITETREGSGDLASNLAAMSLRNLTPAQRLRLLTLVQPDLLRGFWNRDQNVMRIVLQVGEVRGSDKKLQMVEDIQASARERFPQARVSGIAILMTFLVQNLLADQWITFAYAVTAILIMLAIAFRSWRLAVIALIPNAAPILMVVGAMGWFDMKINIASAMLASVSMGLAVDFSIHYLFRFQQELKTGCGFSRALHAAHGSVGLAMVLANLALIAGFSTMLMSSFLPTAHFGLLVSVAMLGGLLGNLLALPILLRYFGSFGDENVAR